MNLEAVNSVQRGPAHNVEAVGDVCVVEKQRDTGRRKAAGRHAPDMRQRSTGDERQRRPPTEPRAATHAAHDTYAAAPATAAALSPVGVRQRPLDLRRRRTVLGGDVQPTDRRCVQAPPNSVDVKLDILRSRSY